MQLQAGTTEAILAATRIVLRQEFEKITNRKGELSEPAALEVYQRLMAGDLDGSIRAYAREAL